MQPVPCAGCQALQRRVNDLQAETSACAANSTRRPAPASARPPLSPRAGLSSIRANQTASPRLLVPTWIEPLPQEPLRSYAARLARQVDPGRPCVVGGASFGGIVALEMAAHLRARACVLISSVRSPGELPGWYRLLRPAAVLGPATLGWLAGQIAGASAPSLPRDVAWRLRQLSDPEAAFLRWASWAVLTWQPSREARRVQVYQIHGSADRTFPVRYTRADIVVPKGGHLLPLTHPQAVNELLRQVEANIAEGGAAYSTTRQAEAKQKTG